MLGSVNTRLQLLMGCPEGEACARPDAAACMPAGLVAFICNLVVAAWIKFGQEDLRTPVLVTVTLAGCLLGMGRSIALWAPHLFQRPQAGSGGSRGDTVVQLGEEYGLPFAWHRVPKPVDDLVRPPPPAARPHPAVSRCGSCARPPACASPVGVAARNGVDARRRSERAGRAGASAPLVPPLQPHEATGGPASSARATPSCIDRVLRPLRSGAQAACERWCAPRRLCAAAARGTATDRGALLVSALQHAGCCGNVQCLVKTHRPACASAQHKRSSRTRVIQGTGVGAAQRSGSQRGVPCSTQRSCPD